MTTLTETNSDQTTENSFSKELTRENITALSNKIRLSDSDTVNNLDVFCYNTCTRDDPQIVKECRGAVFNGDTLVLKGFPFTDEYSLKDFDSLWNLLENKDLNLYDSHEGCLLRVFHFNNKWHVSTHRKLNAFRSKWSSKVSFGQMFVDALEYLYENNKSFKKKVDVSDNDKVYNKFLDSLNTSNQYMFLLRNSYENRIVCQPPENHTVYHVGTFLKDGSLTLEEDVGVEQPTKHSFTTKQEMSDYVQNLDINNIQGLYVYCDGNQYKLLNDDYVELFETRGNEPSIKFRYLQVRMDGKQRQNLYYLYPRHADSFDDYENILYNVAKKINSDYISRFIKKKYVTVPKEEFGVMKKCHAWHLEERVRNRISFTKVIEVLNEQTPSQLNKIIKRFKTDQYNKENGITPTTNRYRPRARSNNTQREMNVDNPEIKDVTIDEPEPMTLDNNEFEVLGNN